MIRLSIVTTLYNSASYIDKCIETLLDQDISPEEYEIILVNDGSPDNSLLIAEQYASAYSNIHIVSYEVNKGLAGARQAGTDVVKGKYLCYVDPDDYIKKQSFAKYLQQMEDEGLDMLRFNYQMVNDAYEVISKPQDARIVDYSPAIMDGISFLRDRLGYGCFVWAYIFRTELIKSSGVKFHQGDYFDDIAWLPQIVRKAKFVNSSPDVRYYYYQRAESLVNTTSKESIIQKLNAELVAVTRLNGQMKIADFNSLKWYRGMNSKIAYSVLSSAAVDVPDMFFSYKKSFEELGVFPLKCPNISRKQKVKIWLLNIAPNIFKFLLIAINK